MMKINKGDKFTVEFTADTDSKGDIVVGSVIGSPGKAFYLSVVKEVIPKPWEPKIGEEVDLMSRISVNEHGFTLLNIHGDGIPFHDGSIRKWATVAFLDDKPEVVLYSCLRKRIKNDQTA